MLKIKLSRNLRRSVLRGHPWIYKEALQAAPSVPQAQLCQVLDAKGELGWAIYDPHGPLSLRMVSLAKNPPNASYWPQQFQQASRLRDGVKSNQTNAFRLFNGEGDRLPGLVCDVYDQVAVLQFDGQGPGEFWNRDQIADWILKNSNCKSVVEKSRRGSERGIEHVAGETCENEVVILEHGARFKVNLEKGQKTGFFLDQRENRLFVRNHSAGKSVLNLFSYTGGFSIYAGLGGAKKVASLDVAKGAIEMAEENWKLNGLNPGGHEGICADVFEYLTSDGEKWDHILVDPPSMGHSESQKAMAIAKYVELFATSAKRVAPRGELSLSSCSSHISFEDFFEIIGEALSQARRRGQIIRISGQGPDHPFPHACFELRYLKFVHLVLD